MRQNLAGMRVHHHHAAASRRCASCTAAARSRSATNCMRSSMRQRDGRARPAARSRVCESMPRRFTSVSMRALPGVPAQFVVERSSIPALPFSSWSTAPDQVRRQRCRSDSGAGSRAETDPVQMQAAQALRLVRADLALDPQEAAVIVVGLLHAAVEVGAVEVQHAATEDRRAIVQVRHSSAGSRKRRPSARSWPAAGRCGRGWCRAGRGFRSTFSCCWRARREVLVVADDLQQKQLGEDDGAPEERRRGEPVQTRRTPERRGLRGDPGASPRRSVTSFTLRRASRRALGFEVDHLAGRRSDADSGASASS